MAASPCVASILRDARKGALLRMRLRDACFASSSGCGQYFLTNSEERASCASRRMRRRARLMVRDGAEEAPPHREAAAGWPPPGHHPVQGLGQTRSMICIVLVVGGTSTRGPEQA